MMKHALHRELPACYTSFGRRAVTLIELLLALSLIVLVCGMMFAFYDASLKSREYGHRRMADDQLARVIAMKIAEEIRSANGFVPSVGPGISGERRVLTLQTVTMPDKELFYQRSIKDEPLPAQCDIRQVQYYLAYDEDDTHTYPDGTEAPAPLGLVRREIKTLFQSTQLETQAESVDLDLLAPEMKYLRFRYFDGIDWVDKWDIGNDGAGKGGNSLPQAVEVTVGYTPLPPEDSDKSNLDEQDLDMVPSEPEPYSAETVTVVVRLPQADTFFGSRLMRAQRRSTMGSGSTGGGFSGSGSSGGGFGSSGSKF
jgi:hypothetical protein